MHNEQCKKQLHNYWNKVNCGRQALLLVALALFVNLFFLYVLYNKHVYFAISQAHGQIGYHLYHCNKIGIDSTLTATVNDRMRQTQQLIDYDSIACDVLHVHEPFPINDTVSYGVLLGLLWKITHSLCFYDVQLVQIIMFGLLMLIYYQVAYLLFGSTHIAFMCGVFQLLFFPLLAYNVMPVRDVWAYYGMLVLLYASLASYYNQITLHNLVICFIFFSCCLWMRPTLACATLLLTIFSIMYMMKYEEHSKKITRFLAVLWLTTGVCFWLPYMRLNYTTYGRCLVSPAGQSLLEGLGELPNRWGHQLNDEYVNEFIANKYNLTYGTVAFDDAAMQEFKSCVKEDPWHYIKTLLYRLPDVLLPGLQWIFYEQSPYVGCTTVWQKLGVVCSSSPNFCNFIARHLWMRVYLLLSYVGLLLLWRHKQYKALTCVLWCMLSGLTTYPSHIEYRYIVPFYWVLSLSLGYLWYYMVQRFKIHIMKGYL